MTQHLIKHNGRYLNRHEDFLAICGEECQAQILSLFEFWSAGRFMEVERERLYSPKERRPRLDLWLYETVAHIEEGLMHSYSDRSIRSALKGLKEKGFISDRQTQDPLDRTKEYLFNIEAIQKAIDEWSLKKNSSRNSKTPVKLEGQEAAFSPPARLQKGDVEVSEKQDDLYTKNLNINNQEDFSVESAIALPELEDFWQEEERADTLDEPEDQVETEGPIQLSLLDLPFVQSSSLAIPNLPEVDQSSGVVEVVTNLNKLTDKDIAEIFKTVYEENKPSNFTNHRKITANQMKNIKRLINEEGEEALTCFQKALIWTREQDDDWWRTKPLTLDNLLSNGKISQFADKHDHALIHDQKYRDRLEGKSLSKDPGYAIPGLVPEDLEIARKQLELVEHQQEMDASRKFWADLVAEEEQEQRERKTQAYQQAKSQVMQELFNQQEGEND